MKQFSDCQIESSYFCPGPCPCLVSCDSPLSCDLCCWPCDLGACCSRRAAPAAASDSALPVLGVEDGFELGLIAECFRYPAAVAANVEQPDRPAGEALHAGYPAVLDFSSEPHPVFPADLVRATFVFPAADSAGGL